MVVGVFTCINILFLKDGCLPACTEYWKKGRRNSSWQWKVCGNRKNSSLSWLAVTVRCLESKSAGCTCLCLCTKQLVSKWLLMWYHLDLLFNVFWKPSFSSYLLCYVVILSKDSLVIKLLLAGYCRSRKWDRGDIVIWDRQFQVTWLGSVLSEISQRSYRIYRTVMSNHRKDFLGMWDPSPSSDFCQEWRRASFGEGKQG